MSRTAHSPRGDQSVAEPRGGGDWVKGRAETENREVGAKGDRILQSSVPPAGQLERARTSQMGRSPWLPAQDYMEHLIHARESLTRC